MRKERGSRLRVPLYRAEEGGERPVREGKGRHRWCSETPGSGHEGDGVVATVTVVRGRWGGEEVGVWLH